MDAKALSNALSLRDLTDAAAGPHAMQVLLAGVVGALRRAWSCRVIVWRASPIVTAEENYDALGYPPDGGARDAKHTRWLFGRTVVANADLGVGARRPARAGCG
jgi:phenylalanyl-tRNA synthetase alpha chain